MNINREMNTEETDLKMDISQIDEKIKDLEEKICEISRENSELKKTIDEICDAKNNESRDNLINELKTKNATLEDELKSFRKEADVIQKSNNFLFNCLFLDSDLEIRGIRRNMQDVSMELMDFVVHVCDKYSLDYWLDFGTLLGARRHEKSIPFDDDTDMSMPRKDYNKLLEVIDDEIREHGLDGIIDVRHDFFNEKSQIMFTQILYLSSNKRLMGALDIFPYDFIKEKSIDNKMFRNERVKFRKEIELNPENRASLEKSFMEKLNLSYDRQDYIIMGVDSALYYLMYFKTDNIYPLCTLKYGDKRFKAPKNPYNHLKKLYGSWKTIPSKIHYHSRLDHLRNNRKFEKEYEVELERIRRINEFF